MKRNRMKICALTAGVCIACASSVWASPMNLPLPAFNACNLLSPGSVLYQQYCAGAVTDSPSYSNTVGATGTVVNAITTNVVMPSVVPLITQEKDKATMQSGMRIRTLGAMLKYENAEFRTGAMPEADIYGGMLGFAMDTEQFTFGVIAPYNYMDFRRSDIKDINQLGGVAFAQYRMPIKDRYELSFHATLDYIWEGINRKVNDDDINTLGGSVGMSLKARCSDMFEPSVMVMYHYGHDDGEIGDHHLIRTGMNLAIYPNKTIALNLYGLANFDETDYPKNVTVTDDLYWDAGIEMAYQATDTFNLTGGYKKVLGMEKFDSDMVYIGSLWKF